MSIGTVIASRTWAFSCLALPQHGYSIIFSNTGHLFYWPLKGQTLDSSAMKSRIYLYPVLALAALFQGCSNSDKPSPAVQVQPEGKTVVSTQPSQPEKSPEALADSTLLPQVAQIVQKTIVRPKKPMNITGRSTWKELGADSLDLAEITLKCEDDFEIQIGDQDLAKVATVGDLARLVERLKNSPAAKKKK